MAETEKVEEVYRTLTSRIQGLESSEVLPRIFKKMLTLEQAQLMEAFPGLPEELATKLGRNLEGVKKDLQYMYKIGLGTPSKRTGKWNGPRNFMLLVDKVGSHHNKFLPFLGPEYVDMWEELHDETDRNRAKRTNDAFSFGGVRVIPAYYAVKDDPNLQPWESMYEILKLANPIALVNCTCRLRNRKRTCAPHTTEVCFMLNRDAEYSVESKAGRYLTLDEAMKVVYNCEKLGVVHQVMNARAVASLLCNCCNDCCPSMRRFFKEGNATGWFKSSRFKPVISEAHCDGCGQCVTCNFSGISIEKNAGGQLKAVVNYDKCMGNGNCVLKCPKGAIKMEVFRPETWVPKGMWTRPGESRDYPQYAEML